MVKHKQAEQAILTIRQYCTEQEQCETCLFRALNRRCLIYDIVDVNFDKKLERQKEFMGERFYKEA